jgi:multidrug efflux pump subunit AcrA (membrane-fusion protein)
MVESADRDVLVASPVAGIISAVHVAVGESVTAGDPLFTVDQREALADVGVRSAALAVARAEQLELEEAARKATLDLQRVSAVDDMRAVSAEERASRESGARAAAARLATAQATVRARRAELQAAHVASDERVVRAPIAGEVLGLSARVGEATGATSSALVRLGRVDRLHVRVDIDENDAWRIRPGTRARLIMRGNGALIADLQYEYLERYVRPKTQLTGASTERVDTRVLQMVYSLPATSLPLYVGQQVDVVVEVPTAGGRKS